MKCRTRLKLLRKIHQVANQMPSYEPLAGILISVKNSRHILIWSFLENIQNDITFKNWVGRQLLFLPPKWIFLLHFLKCPDKNNYEYLLLWKFQFLGA